MRTRARRGTRLEIIIAWLVSAAIAGSSPLAAAAADIPAQPSVPVLTEPIDAALGSTTPDPRDRIGHGDYPTAALVRGSGIKFSSAPSAPPAPPTQPEAFLFNVLASFKGDPFSGSVVGAIPLSVPPGRRGVQPSLELLYSSSNHNSWVGVGWDLSWPTIQRSTKRGIPTYTDADVFVFFDGKTQEELVPIGDRVYRAKVEEDFQRFVFQPATNTWLVTTREGSMLLFGPDNTARQNTGAGTFAWALGRVTDVHGNYLTVEYLKHLGHFYPTEIHYTGHDGTHLAPKAFISFTFEDRPDPFESAISGERALVAKRLKRITMTVDGQLARRYDLGYTQSAQTGRSLLASLTIVGSDGTSALPPVTFQYQARPGGWSADQPQWHSPDGDFNATQSPGAYADADQGRQLHDLNGDGWTDFVVARHDPDNGRPFYKATHLSSAAGFNPTPNWTAIPMGFFIYKYWDDGRRLVDLNGDGKPEELVATLWDPYTGSSGQFRSGFRHTGVNWVEDHTWDLPDNRFFIYGNKVDGGVRFGDLNGDGLTDLIISTDRIPYSARGLDVVPVINAAYLNTGSGWRRASSWDLRDTPFIRTNGQPGDAGAGYDGGARLADVNGDGLTDFLIAANGFKRTLLNNGSGWTTTDQWNLPADEEFTTANRDRGRWLADINGDGLVDLCIAEGSTRRTYLNTGSGWKRDDSWNLPDGAFVDDAGRDQGRRLADLNGDNVADLMVAKDGTRKAYLNLAGPPDLLVAVHSGLGGATSFAYAPSTTWDNRGVDDIQDLPFILNTVRTATLNDGLGHTYTTTYRYAGGLYDAATREFRGFGHVWVADGAGTETETIFYQDEFFTGKPYNQKIADAQGHLFREEQFGWKRRELFPGVNLVFLAQHDSLTWDGDATLKQTQVQLTYDDFGDVTKEQRFGDVDLASDDVTITTDYVSNTDAWILGRPRLTKTLAAAGTLIAQRRFFYDGATDPTTLPALGDLTKEEVWLTQPGAQSPEQWLATTLAYDTYGNVATVTDALGRVTTNAYDPTGTYLTKITNPLGHAITSTFDPATGNVLTTTDPNGATTTHRYDPLGRLIATIGPNDTDALPTVQFSYDLATVPTKTVTRTRIQSGQAAVLTVSTFSDGVGRALQTRAPAEDPAKQVVTGTVEYDARGLVVKQWLPYLSAAADTYVPLSDEPAAVASLFVSSRYDALGRVIELKGADGSASTTRYDDWTTTTIDANGHQLVSSHDGYGRLVKVEEFTGADGRSPLYPVTPYQRYATTTYGYNAANNLTTVTDAKGNVTRMSYDTLGRKVSMDDPDMGTWTYAYDAVGNLTSQTDARNVTTTFTYDALNRVTQKSYTIPPGSQVSGLMSPVSYTYDNPAKPFAKGKLTEISDSSGSSSFEYDVLGRLTKESKTLDSTTYPISRTYDLLGRLTSLTYPDGDIAAYTYNAQGGIKTVALQSAIGNPQSAIVTDVDYNAAGQLTRITYGNGVVSDYSYDPQTLRLSHLLTSSLTHSTLQDFSYAFDAIGNVTAITDQAHTGTQTFQYDKLNRLTEARGAYGTLVYAYDSIGNMTTKEGVTMSYGLPDGNLALTPGVKAKPHAVTSTSNGLTLSYDATGNLISKTPSASTLEPQAQLQYDAENRLTQVGLTPPSTQTVSLPLAAGWNFLTLPVVPSDRSVAAVLGSALATVPQVSRFDAATGAWEHFVNSPPFNQFDTFEAGRGYAVYCTAPATLSVAGTAAAGSLSLPAGTSLLGNPSPNPINVQGLLGSLRLGLDVTAAWRYNGTGFSALSQSDLVQPGEAVVVKTSSARTWSLPSGPSTTRFVYDGDGGRVKQVTPAGTTRFLGQSVEIAPNGTTTKYLFAGSQRLAAQDSTGARRFYHGDHLGSSNVVTDGSGALVELAEYTPYGSLSHHEGPANVPQQFTGQRFDASTGFYFYHARYYDPQLGRFIQADTVVPAPGDPQALNRYSYVRNNPLTYTDPSGHGWFKKFFKKFGAAVLQAAGVVLAPFTGGASLLLSAAGTIVSGVQAAQAGQFAAWAAGFAISAGLGLVFPTPSFSNLGLQVGFGALRGAAIGAVSGGITSVLAGGSFGRGAGYGALGGAAGGAIAGIATSQQYQNLARREGFYSNREVRVNHYRQDNAVVRALSMNAKDQTALTVGARPIGGPIGAGHRYIAAPNGNRFEMGPLRQGGPIVTSNTADVSTWDTSLTTQNAITAGLATTASVNVSTSGFVTSMGLYEAYFGGQQYNALSYNSNFAVNSVLYGAGGPEVKNLGYTPGFPDN